MTLRYLPLLLILFAPASAAQDPFALGGTGFDEVRALASADDGTTFVGGVFVDYMDVDPGPDTVELVSSGEKDGFVASYTPDGTLRWAFALGDTLFSAVNGLALGPDPSGGTNLYITGSIDGTVDFDPGPGEHVLSSHLGAPDAFIAAYDADQGTLKWAHVPLSLGRFDEGLALATVGSRLYATGVIDGIADMDPGPNEWPIGSPFPQDIYLAAFTSEGALEWTFSIGSEGAVGGLYDAGYGVAADEDHVVITGSFSRLLDVDPGPEKAFLIGDQAGYPCAFIASYTVNGEYEWAHEFNGMAGSGGGDFPDGGTAIALDTDGNVYATGFFNDTVDFDPGPGEAIFVNTNNDLQDGYVVSFTPEGAFRWVHALQSFGANNVKAVAVAPEGHLYVGGSFSITVDFDPGPGSYPVTATAYDDLFVASYALDGELRWVHTAGDPPAPDYYPWNVTNALAAIQGGVVAGGHFDGTIDLGAGVITTAGNKDGWVAWFESGDGPVTSEPSPSPRSSLSISTPRPNPTRGMLWLTLTAEIPGPVTVEVFDALGRRLARVHDGAVPGGQAFPLTLNTAAFSAGAYFVRAVDGHGNVATQQFIVAH